MANEIAAEYQSGKTLKAYVYYDNAGIRTLRGSVALTEFPADSGLYANATEVTGLALGDWVILKDETDTPKVIGGDEYIGDSALIDEIEAIKEQTDKLRFTEDSDSFILSQTGISTGAVAKTAIIKDTNDEVISNAEVWLSIDIGGDQVVASGTTDNYGSVTFYVTPGTYYLFSRKAGYNFTNPQQVVA